MRFHFPAGVLAQHLAVLGKTGSGKTSTAKLCVEQVAAEGARVCILDPIKSDWWGLTSSADGKRAGLPFQILGGPRGHVPLHDGAGKAIGEVVANGTLPLSIIDMADFAPGGQARFFVDFAPTLIRKMRGVIYLVIEEAHLFAPKERSGVGAENMSIHWAKTMATAGRSKGIRLILVTQRTQALHNALLGSCETMIAHRLSAPADQEPVVKWLKANTDKDTTLSVSGSLASLPTGEGWICSGEAKVFERMRFPRIKTYDNSATPTGDSGVDQVKTAPVDADKLRSIIGDAVKTAEANDPVVLKKRIAELERQAKAQTAAATNPAEVDRAYQDGFADGRSRGWKDCAELARPHLGIMRDQALKMSEGCNAAITAIMSTPQFDGASPQNPVRRVNGGSPQVKNTMPAPAPVRQIDGRAPSSEIGTGGKRRILTALAQYPEGMPSRRLSILVDISLKGGTWSTYLGDLRSRGWVEGGANHLKITPAGIDALGHYDPLPTGDALIEYWRTRLGASGKRAIFDAVVAAYPGDIAQDDVAKVTGIARTGGTWSTYLGELRGLGLVEGRTELRASRDLFQ